MTYLGGRVMTRPYGPLSGIACRGGLQPAHRSKILNAAGTVEIVRLRVWIYPVG